MDKKTIAYFVTLGILYLLKMPIYVLALVVIAFETYIFIQDISVDKKKNKTLKDKIERICIALVKAFAIILLITTVYLYTSQI